MCVAQKFSIGFQNVQGMHNGIGCKINEINSRLSNDIEILAETWGCKCNISFDNYIPHYVSPQKHLGVRKGRSSGGFTILIKPYLDKSVNILKMSNNFVWMEIDKKVVNNMEENLIVVGTYINDITSTYYDDKIFEELYSDIYTFCGENTPVLFTGDFNGRTGEVDDIFRGVGGQDMGIEQQIPTPNTFVDLPKRRNCDILVNSHGKKIIQICHTFDYKILNGRMAGDILGNFTHLNTNSGESTIDYSICNEPLYQCVENFMILPLNEVSDHSKIITVFKTSIPIPILKNDKYNWHPLKDSFKWDIKKKTKYVETLKSCVNEIEEISQRIEAGLINSTGDKLQKLLVYAAKSSLDKRSINKTWKKRKKSKKWFDKECQELKYEASKIARKKHENPKENLLKKQYHDKLKEYLRANVNLKGIFSGKTLLKTLKNP